MTSTTNEKLDVTAMEVESIPDKNAAQHVGDYSGAVVKSDPKEIALVKKLDMHIMPALFCMYFLNKLDQNALANARLNKIEKDLHLHGTQYNTCISILYVGYLFMQIPSNMLVSSGKVRPSYYLAATTAAWATVAALTALVHNYATLVVCRFFLGVVEAPFYPAALYLLSIFYTRKEIATRVAILYSGNIFATAFAGLIAAATFETLNGAHGIQGWRWLFIIEGVVTFGVAIIAGFLLPDYPLTTRWLNPEERQLAHDRMLRDTVVRSEEKGARAGLMQALKDPRLYLFVLMQNMHLSATSFNQFFPTVVGSLGYNSIITLVLTCPPSLFAGMVGILVGLSSGKFNERTWHITIAMSLALGGFLISAVTMNVAARYVACFMFAAGVYAVNSVILGWVSATCGQTPEKKAVTLSVVNMCAMASFIYTPYLYPKWDGPQYTIAMSSNAAFAVMTILCAWGMKIWLRSSNKKLKETGTTDGLYYAY